MKTIIAMAFFAMPFFVFAQAKGTTAPAPAAREASKDAGNQGKFRVQNPSSFYIEMIVGETSVGSSIRIDYGRELLSGLTDKEQINQLMELRSAGFTNIPDALNYLTSIGFNYVSDYNLTLNNKNETHFLLVYRTTAKGSHLGSAASDRIAPASHPASTPVSKSATDAKSVKPQIKDTKK